MPERARPAERRIAAVVLAAGTSSRLGRGELKQLLAPTGEPLARRTCRLALAAGLEPVVAVLGHRADEVASTLCDLDVELTLNSDYAEGQSTSVRRGLQALGEIVDGALFMPCDQPFLDRETLEALVDAFAGLGESARCHIVVPRSSGRRGSPVLFGAAYFGELQELRGDEGGRQLLGRHGGRVSEVELESERPLFDIDTLEDVARARGSGR